MKMSISITAKTDGNEREQFGLAAVGDRDPKPLPLQADLDGDTHTIASSSTTITRGTGRRPPTSKSPSGAINSPLADNRNKATRQSARNHAYEFWRRCYKEAPNKRTAQAMRRSSFWNPENLTESTRVTGRGAGSRHCPYRFPSADRRNDRSACSRRPVIAAGTRHTATGRVILLVVIVPRSRRRIDRTAAIIACRSRSHRRSRRRAMAPGMKAPPPPPR